MAHGMTHIMTDIVYLIGQSLLANFSFNSGSLIILTKAGLFEVGGPNTATL